MNRKNEKGIALILTLMLLLVISVIAVSLMFISQTETWASLNYRLMDQARDGAEAGINAAANYIINTYTPPATGGADPISNYNNNVSPVQYPAANSGNHDVILSTSSSKKASNYPVSSVETAFRGAAEGNLTAGNSTVGYATSATLLSQQQVTPWGTTTPTTVQTWMITSDGTINGIRTADEEVSAVLEKQVSPLFEYAAFATGQGCGALNFGGGGSTDSYSSTAPLSGGVPVISASDGSVGTNGNLATSGSSTTINGTLSTPRTGTGTCTSGSVTAWSTSSGHLSCGPGLTGTQCLVDLPQQVTYANPDAPNPTPPLTSSILNNSAVDCIVIGGGCTFGTGGACALGDFCLAPGGCPTDSPAGTPAAYGNITVKGTLHLTKGCYNVNSLVENGGGTIQIDSGPVILNVAGTGVTNPVNLTGGGTITAAGFDPALFQIMYAGSGTINLKGGANAVGVVYAPNSTFSFAGGSNWYGAVIGNNMTDMGGTTLNYDRNLQKLAVTVSKWMLDSFTWSKH